MSTKTGEDHIYDELKEHSLLPSSPYHKDIKSTFDAFGQAMRHEDHPLRGYYAGDKKFKKLDMGSLDAEEFAEKLTEMSRALEVMSRRVKDREGKN